MNNMGGICKLYYIDAEDFSSMSTAESGLTVLALEQGKSAQEISFTEDTGRISESEEQTENGTAYNIDIACRIPACDNSNKDPFSGKRNKKLLFIAEDSNGNLWLTGAPGSYFNISVSSDTGGNTQDMNGRSVKISASLASGSVFLSALP
jgi:hypothetical protein